MQTKHTSCSPGLCIPDVSVSYNYQNDKLLVEWTTQRGYFPMCHAPECNVRIDATSANPSSFRIGPSAGSQDVSISAYDWKKITVSVSCLTPCCVSCFKNIVVYNDGGISVDDKHNCNKAYVYYRCSQINNTFHISFEPDCVYDPSPYDWLLADTYEIWSWSDNNSQPYRLIERGQLELGTIYTPLDCEIRLPESITNAHLTQIKFFNSNLCKNDNDHYVGRYIRYGSGFEDELLEEYNIHPDI